MSDKHFPDRRHNDEEAMKKIMKQAVQEWLDSKFSTFGNWTAMGIGAAALALLAWGIIQMNGVPWGK